MRHAKSLPLKSSRPFGFQWKRQLSPKVNLLRSLAREMNVAQPVHQSPRDRQRRPLVGVNPSMHTEERALTKPSLDSFFAEPLCA